VLSNKRSANKNNKMEYEDTFKRIINCYFIINTEFNDKSSISRFLNIGSTSKNYTVDDLKI